MGPKILKRIASSAVLGLVIISCISLGYIYICLMLLIAMILMMCEWNQINIKPLRKPVLYTVGYVYIAIPMLFWIVFLYFNPEYKTHLLLVFIIVWSVDVFAYFGGKIFKGPKLAPLISPKKTWSGAISGSFMAIVVSIICMYSIQFSVSLLNLLLVMILAIASIIGDLIESKAKRTLNVKDSGNIIPGHGGICDRLDSFMMATYAYATMALFLQI
ncbi:MAG: phosphatidate cytidylyltransferase [Holosporales bacterium]|jgi:phosphatidate cytidylyltransferase|nr:phosphatidate cytidylyltransferase [Holosporales bacterium]